jgi:hypothetical protein
MLWSVPKNTSLTIQKKTYADGKIKLIGYTISATV